MSAPRDFFSLPDDGTLTPADRAILDAALVETMRSATRGLANRAIDAISHGPHPSVTFAALVIAARDFGEACGWTLDDVDEMLAGRKAPTSKGGGQ